MQKIVEFHKITAKFLIRKEDWDNDHQGIITKQKIEDKIQQGIETPIEDVEIVIE